LKKWQEDDQREWKTTSGEEFDGLFN